MILSKKNIVFVLCLLQALFTFSIIAPTKDQVIVGTIEGKITSENHAVIFMLKNNNETTKVIFKNQLPSKLEVCKDNLTITGTYNGDVFEAKSVATSCYELPDMADDYRSNGKIYIVVGVVLIVLLGVIAYLFNINSRINNLNEEN